LLCMYVCMGPVFVCVRASCVACSILVPHPCVSVPFNTRYIASFMEIKKHTVIKTAADEAAFCVTLQGILERHKHVGMMNIVSVLHPSDCMANECRTRGCVFSMTFDSAHLGSRGHGAKTGTSRICQQFGRIGRIPISHRLS
jgi:hypothetical protein